MTVKQAPRHRGDAKPVTPLNELIDTASMTAVGKRGIAIASATGIALTAAVTSAASAATAPTALPQAPSDDFVSNLESSESATLVSLDVEWEPGDEVAVKAEEPAPEPEPEPVVVEQAAATGQVASRSTTTDSVEAAATQETVSYPGASASGIVATALQFVGYPYVYGGASPATGFDCSGFTSYVFGLHGISLPRTAGAQGGAGTVIPASAAQPGDLVVWSHGGHVAIYIGGGQVVHASTPATGVKIGAMWGSYYFVRV